MVGLELATLQLAVKLQRFNCSVTKPPLVSYYVDKLKSSLLMNSL